jgi:hypothetical protein
MASFCQWIGSQRCSSVGRGAASDRQSCSTKKLITPTGGITGNRRFAHVEIVKGRRTFVSSAPGRRPRRGSSWRSDRGPASASSWRSRHDPSKTHHCHSRAELVVLLHAGSHGTPGASLACSSRDQANPSSRFRHLFVTGSPTSRPSKQPDRFLARTVRHGALVVLESTTYSGPTEDVLRPVLEQSGLQAGRDSWPGRPPSASMPGTSGGYWSRHPSPSRWLQATLILDAHRRLQPLDAISE